MHERSRWWWNKLWLCAEACMSRVVGGGTNCGCVRKHAPEKRCKLWPWPINFEALGFIQELDIHVSAAERGGGHADAQPVRTSDGGEC
eukprot:356808-Chlamydomonas_euryale.AAC.1